MKRHVVVLSLLVPTASGKTAERVAHEIASKIQAETEAENVCVDHVYPQRKIV